MSNPLRNCLGCGQVDDHPRHVVILPDHSEVAWHNDCHARATTPCESCAALVETANGVTGEDYRAHLHNLETWVHVVDNYPHLLSVEQRDAITEARDATAPTSSKKAGA